MRSTSFPFLWRVFSWEWTFALTCTSMGFIYSRWVPFWFSSLFLMSILLSFTLLNGLWSQVIFSFRYQSWLFFVVLWFLAFSFRVTFWSRSRFVSLSVWFFCAFRSWGSPPLHLLRFWSRMLLFAGTCLAMLITAFSGACFLLWMGFSKKFFCFFEGSCHGAGSSGLLFSIIRLIMIVS